MSEQHPTYEPDDPVAVNVYRKAMHCLTCAGVEFLIGGAYAFALYTGIDRPTKDFDLFLRPCDRDLALEALDAAGFRTEVAYSHWLAKAHDGPYFVDLIYSSGNGAASVDDDWFRYATPSEVLGEPVYLCPPEESLWSKAFIMERHRYDGADVAHLMLVAGPKMDWERLIARFDSNWRVLYSHLILFGFIYPAERDRIPAWVLRELNRRARHELGGEPSEERVCQGTLLTTKEYRPDVEQFGFEDVRLEPRGSLTPEQIAEWTQGVSTGR